MQSVSKDFDSNFVVEDIQQSLLEVTERKYCGIEDFQEIYECKRVLSDAISEYKVRNRESKENIQRARQRMCQLEHLAERADRHSVLLQKRVEKVNDVHMMSKILMMEKMVQMQQQYLEANRRREQCERVRRDKREASLWNKHRLDIKYDKIKEASLAHSHAVKDCLEELKYATLQDNKCRADKVKQQRSRKQSREKRYSEFKLDFARKNYLAKVNCVNETLNIRSNKLQALQQNVEMEEMKYDKTHKITKEYISSLFPTETI